MCIIPTPFASAHKLQARIEAKLTDAIWALEAADMKLLKAADGYEGTDQLPIFALWEAQFNARLFARMLEDTVAAGTTLPRRVFNALESYANRDARNPSHIEGGILALTLAERSLDDAMTLIQQFEGDEVNAAFEVALAARGTIRSYATLLWQAVHGFEHDAVLDGILAGKRQPATSGKRRLALAAA